MLARAYSQSQPLLFKFYFRAADFLCNPSLSLGPLAQRISTPHPLPHSNSPSPIPNYLYLVGVPPPHIHGLSPFPLPSHPSLFTLLSLPSFSQEGIPSNVQHPLFKGSTPTRLALPLCVFQAVAIRPTESVPVHHLPSRASTCLTIPVITASSP